MLSSPTPDQVRSLASDPGAARAGEGLGGRRHWTATGRNERAAWGLCQGSGANPYQVTVDFGGPAFKCTCPSRKFPCKHGLGLLFLLAIEPAALPPTAEPPAWAADWLATRSAKAEAADAKVAVSKTTPGTDDGVDGSAAAAASAVDVAATEAARERRIQARERKVDAGLVDLDRWIGDLVRRGLVAAKGEGYAFWDQAGARLVDAQAASLGREVRALGAAANQASGWADDALERIARLHLIVEAYRRQDRLPDDLRADVRSLVGWTIKEDDLPEDGAVSDRWLVIGRTVRQDERLTTARTWLLGETSGRFGLHLAFGAGGANPVPIAMAGTSFRASIRFFPSATPLRTVVGDGPLDQAGAFVTLPGGLTIADAAAAFATVLSRNPFVTTWPTVLADVVPVGRDGELVLRDPDGAAIRVTPAAIAARLVAVAGGRPVQAFGLWTGRSIVVLAAVAEGRLIDLGTDGAGDDADGGSGGGPSIVSARAAGGTGNDPWSHLVRTALLGTERGDPPPIALPAAVASVAELPVAMRLLGTVAIVATRRRAGWLPAEDRGPMPEPAAPDPRRVVGPAAGWLLGRVIEDSPDLLPEWLGLARAADRRPPDEELPRLLALAARQPRIRTALGPILGSRAEWLVHQLPELAAGLPAGRMGAGPAMDPTAAWSAATSAAARAGVVGALRVDDAAAARALLDAIWEGATTEERALAIAALADGLGPADEEVLGRAWEDRRIEVRSAAIDLLARLPDSSFAALAASIARPLLATAGRFRPSLAIQPPAEWSDDLGRLGVPRKPPQGTGERAWWLRHVIARVAPSRWVEWLGIEPKGLIERAIQSDETAALLLGWIEATIRARDNRWASALLAAHDVLNREDVQALGPFELFDVLPPRDQDATAAALIGRADTAIARDVATHCPGPWGPLVSWAVLNALAREKPAIGISAAFIDLLGIAVQRLPPDQSAQLEKIVASDERLLTYPIISRHLAVIEFRNRMHAAFAAKEGAP